MDVPPDDARARLISRIKILGDMDISERRAPQDGRMLVQMGASKSTCEFRRSRRSTAKKRSSACWIPNAAKVDFAALGLSKDRGCASQSPLAAARACCWSPVPPARAKRPPCTPRSIKFASRTKNIITVEDPVEYMLEGINQVQVNVKAGRHLRQLVCGPSCVRIPTSSWLAKFATPKPRKSRFPPRKPATWFFPLCTPTTVLPPSPAFSTWVCPAFLIRFLLSAIIAQRLVRKLCGCCQRGSPCRREFAALLA